MINFSDSEKEKIDVFSLGCILFQSVYGEAPFTKADHLKVMQSDMTFRLPNELQGKVDKTKGLIKIMIANSPDKRPTMDEVIEKFNEK